MPISPKCRRKGTHRPGSRPSATRQAAHKRKHATQTDATTSPKTKSMSTLPTVPSPKKTNDRLSSVPNEQTLPDLVLKEKEKEMTHPETAQGANTTDTEEELDATATLLSLGTIRDDTLDDDTENAELMPISGQSVPIDVAPEPIRLDQVSVDKAIAGLIQDEEVTNEQKTDSKGPDTKSLEMVEPTPVAEDTPTIKGALKMKTYALKKKMNNRHRSFKCSECKVVKKTIKELNIHHRESHNPQICGICNQSFKLASSLTRHMYDHNELKLKCDQCDYRCHFESKLQTHKINHQKNPSYQCMKANCGKWFRRNWDLTLHLQKHDGV